MKLLLAFYFYSCLFSSVTLLNCFKCTSDSGRCSTTFSQQCPPGNLCAALIYNYSVPGFSVNRNGEIRGCFPQAVCKQMNPRGLKTSYSANIGVAKGFLSVSCCQSDYCNLIIISDKKPNGLQCLSCRKLTDTVCRSSISCVGNQDHCMTGTVLSMANLTMKGCASKSFCTTNFQNSTLGDVQCCKGNLCNKSKTWNRPDVGLLLMILIFTKILQ